MNCDELEFTAENYVCRNCFSSKYTAQVYSIFLIELPEADVGRTLFENTGTFRELFGAVFGRFGG